MCWLWAKHWVSLLWYLLALVIGLFGLYGWLGGCGVGGSPEWVVEGSLDVKLGRVGCGRSTSKWSCK